MQELYRKYASGDGGHPNLTGEVAKIVERQPEEFEAIRTFVEQRDGADAGHALLAAVEDAKRKKNGISFKGGALDFGGNGLFPSFRPTWAGSTSDEKESRTKAEAADFKKEEGRRVIAKGDKPYNPILDALNSARNGPEAEPPEVTRNGDKLMDAINADLNRQRDGGTPDAGTPDASSVPGIRKRVDN